MYALVHRARPCIARYALHSVTRPPVTLLARSVQSTVSRETPSHAPSNADTMSTAPDGTPQIIYSSNQPADLPDRASQLTSSSWTISPSHMGLIRQFTFPTFATTWRFMSIVAEECKTKRHHPSWHNLYNKVTIEWTTHSPEGLSIKDVEMAEFCDRTASQIRSKKPRDQSAGTASSRSPDA